MNSESWNRRTCVAVYGMSLEEWSHWKEMVKGGLQSMHMGWSFASSVFATAAELIANINAREDLEIVYLCNNGPDRQKLIEDTKAIAETICRHTHKPWVVLDHGLEYLIPVLKENGIEVQCGMFEHIIHDRWANQLEDAA